jgi:cell division protein FtsQ
MFVSIWVVIAGGITILLAAAMRKQKNERCRDYRITIKGKENHFFADGNAVRELLLEAAKGEIKGQLLSSLNLKQLETVLEDNAWINEAELYFDNQDNLHVNVTERSPLARVFTTKDESFYIDSTGRRLPLSDKKSARVPVFTGFPGKKNLNGRDSLMLHEICSLAQFIMNDSFWMAQVSQIDISPEGEYLMIPVVGNHAVKLGDGSDIPQKFRRLFIFYTQVLNKTGFERYRTVDVQFAGQVIASRQTGNIKIDSIQLRRNVEKLLQQARLAQYDTTILKYVAPPAIATETPLNNDLETTQDIIDPPLTKAGQKTMDPDPVKTNSVSKPNEQTGNKNNTGPVKQSRAPKAVMKKKSGLR